MNVAFRADAEDRSMAKSIEMDKHAETERNADEVQELWLGEP
jgi:hypothetical protein